MRICAIGAKLLPYTKAKIQDSFRTRHVDEKLPEVVRGNIVICVLECVPGQASQSKPALNGSANIREESRERAHNGYPVYRYRLRALASDVNHRSVNLPAVAGIVAPDTLRNYTTCWKLKVYPACVKCVLQRQHMRSAERPGPYIVD